LSGPNVDHLKEFVCGVPSSNSILDLFDGIPKKSSGRLMGKLHCPGQSQISASLKILERAGSPILCSSPEALGRIIVFTLP